jgi:hypothetical protein
MQFQYFVLFFEGFLPVVNRLLRSGSNYTKMCDTYSLHITSFPWSRCNVFTLRAPIDPSRDENFKTYLDSQDLIVLLGTKKQY